MKTTYGKIWRTVVFSGAMLSAPVVSADAPKKPAPAKPAAKPESVEKLKQELVELDKKISAAVDAVVAAQNDKDRAAAKAKLDALQKEKAALDERLAAAKAAAAKAPTKPAPADPVEKLQRDLDELNTKINAAADAVASAQNDADRKLATAKLADLRKQKAELEGKLAAEKAKQAKKEPEKRPRAKEDDRPIGRGFILS